jgi:para-aminobenzoate synthetase / 4-amino-4-deoxychorismate lyase
VDASALSKLATKTGFAILRDGPIWRLYRNPIKLLVAHDTHSLHESLFLIEQHVKRGGEAAGFFSYEAGYAVEARLQPLLTRTRSPLCFFGLYEACSILKRAPFDESTADNLALQPQLLITYDKYCARLAAIRRLIENGEVYQINFTTSLQFKTELRAWELFRRLFCRQPAPHAAFLNAGAQQIVSLSPESFFHIDRDLIMVRPMKGTAERGLTLERDIARGRELSSSEKNRAENVMIVDLLRNDLGRICRIGSVRTEKLFEVERFPLIWQMTSAVDGRLVKGWTIPAVVRALFPSGSVTGAPKIRAMEHIAELENSPRGVYTGAIGFFAPSHSRFNVAIRTVVLDGQTGTMGVGSGITHDSSPSNEWEECGWKAGFLTQKHPHFELIETMLWDSQYKFLKQHLGRMRDSAEYFGFHFPGKRIRGVLLEIGQQFESVRQRVRITLARNGKFQISHAPVTAEWFGRVRVSEKTVSTKDVFLYHKTTNRRVYEQELAAARNANCDDALFLNERGELTEGAIHNVFVVKNGIWRTPAVACGLLPGTYRSRFLRKLPNACVALLTRRDLVEADKIYLCNSVRGISAVELV